MKVNGIGTYIHNFEEQVIIFTFYTIHLPSPTVIVGGIFFFIFCFCSSRLLQIKCADSLLLRHDKTNKMPCAPSEDINQPGRSSNLMRVFAVGRDVAKKLSYP